MGSMALGVCLQAGERCGKYRVARIMRKHKIKAVRAAKRHGTVQAGLPLAAAVHGGRTRQGLGH